ncbi:MAG: SIS domain-containing protein [bacterium]|nr:SIS domain-containing protein [bacterium]
MKIDSVPFGMQVMYDFILEEIGVLINKIDFDNAHELTELIVSKQQKRIFVAGKGRSGLISKAFAMRLLHLGFDVSVVGETTTPAIHEGDLLIISSGSGSYIIDKGDRNFELVGITTDKDSNLAKRADLTIILPAVSKIRDKSKIFDQCISIQPMGSLFEQILFIFLEGIVLYLMMRLSIYSTEMFTRHANVE